MGKVLSHYRLEARIGQGGMSSVFRALDLHANRHVAVKILTQTAVDEANFKARFEREARLLLQLQHPHIIPILDFGEVDGLAFIVMPFISTGTLSRRLAEGPIDPLLGGRMVSQLASALHHAHEQGVVHRDVKPSNILLDPQGNVLLSDFSFAHLSDASQDLTGSALVGTPAYMSPEQCRGGEIDARSDQYSFAVVLYQMTTGTLPFEGDTPMAIALQHLHTPLPRPRRVNPNLPIEVELVLIRALAKDPGLRYPSVRDLDQAFQSALAIALDPHRRAADERTRSVDHTADLYRKYQNVRPAAPARRRYDRPAILALLLLLLACTVSAGAIAIIYPEIFHPADAASATGFVDLQATVDVLLTENAPAVGTILAPGELETVVYAAVLQTMEAADAMGTDTAATETPLPTDTQATVTGAPSARPTFTRTPSRTPSHTPTPSITSTFPPGFTPSPTATASSTLPSTPTSTGPTVTSGPPTGTASSVPPSPTSPPTGTPPAPTAITPAAVCEWDAESPSVSEDEVEVRVNNTGDLPVRVTGVSITWTGNENLRQIHWRFEGSFWTGNDPGPTVSAGTNKIVPLATYRTVFFEFWGSSFDGSASVSIDADC